MEPSEIDPRYEFFVTICLRGHGRAEEALEILQKRLALEPDNHRARSLMAQTLRQLARHAEALQEARALTLADAQSSDFHALYASLLFDAGDFKAALAEGQTAIRLEPDHRNEYCFVGNVYRRMGDLAAAISNYEKALALYGSGDAETVLGEMYEETGRLGDAIEA